MANSKEIVVGDKHSGISIEYIKSKQMLNISGWYDGNTGLCEPVDISLKEFIKRLGIPCVIIEGN